VDRELAGTKRRLIGYLPIMNVDYERNDTTSLHHHLQHDVFDINEWMCYNTL
jgi:hypothetical protein